MRYLFLSSLISSAAFALAPFPVPESACTAVDVRDAHPETREFLSTPRNQDSVGWCYAMTSADLLTVHTGKPVSALHLSTLYNDRADRNFLSRGFHGLLRTLTAQPLEAYQGGRVTSAVAAARKLGWVCSEEKLPFDTLEGLMDTSVQVGALQYLRDEYRDGKMTEQVVCQNYTRVLPHALGVDDLTDIQFILGAKNLNRGMENVATRECENDHIDIGRVEIKNVGKPFRQSRKGEFLESLNGALESGKPVAMSYDAGAVTLATGAHSSVLIARRWRDGKCEYKVRNSWGQSCAPYKPNVICEESEGAYWVNDELLYEMATSLQFVK